MRRVKLKQSTSTAKAPAEPTGPKLREIRIHTSGGAPVEIGATQDAQAGAPAETGTTQVKRASALGDAVAGVVTDAGAPAEGDLDDTKWPHQKPSPAMRAFIRQLRSPRRRSLTKDEAWALAEGLGVTDPEFKNYWPSVHPDLKHGRGRLGAEDN